MSSDTSKMPQALQRAVPIARGLMRTVAMLLLSLVVCLLWLCLYLGAYLHYSWWLLAIPILITLSATLILGLFYWSLDELAQAPNTLRSVGGELKSRLSTDKSPESAEDGAKHGVFSKIFSLRGLMLDLVDVLGQYGSLTLLISPVFLMLCAAAVVAAVLLIPVTVIGLLFLIF